MKKAQKRQIAKIPHSIEVFYNKEKKIIVFRGSVAQKSLKIHPLVSIHRVKQQLEVITSFSGKLSNSEKKKLKSIQRSTVSLIKQLLIETTVLVYQKIKFVGVGYRAFPVENFENNLLLLKLGYSHPIYFKVHANINIFCLKLTKLFIYGTSYKQVTSAASQIRLNKTPEPYKGKGVLYENENITLKEGKKV